MFLAQKRSVVLLLVLLALVGHNKVLSAENFAAVENIIAPDLKDVAATTSDSKAVLEDARPIARELSSSSSSDYSDDYYEKKRRRRRKRRRRQRMMRRRRRRPRSESNQSFAAPEKWTGTSSWSHTQPDEDDNNGGGRQRMRMRMSHTMNKKMMKKIMWKPNPWGMYKMMSNKKMMRPFKMGMNRGMNTMTTGGRAKMMRMGSMYSMNMMKRKRKVMRKTWAELKQRKKNMRMRTRRRWIRRQQRMERRRDWKEKQDLTQSEHYVYNLYYGEEYEGLSGELHSGKASIADQDAQFSDSSPDDDKEYEDDRYEDDSTSDDETYGDDDEHDHDDYTSSSSR